VEGRSGRGAARGGQADLIEPMDAETSLGAALSLWLAASAQGQGGGAAIRSDKSPVLTERAERA
jgi:hypothetical protein